MDKLNNITRTGGYPLVAEGVEILSKHGDFITAIMDGMRIAPKGAITSKTAVILQYEKDFNGVLINAVIYFLGGAWQLGTSKRGRILYLTGDGTTKLDDLINGTVSKTITIQKTDYSVTDGGTTYPNAYSTEIALLTAPSLFDVVDFCFLKSLETEKKTDYVSSISSIVCSVNGGNSNFGLTLNNSQKNFIRKSDSKVEIQLSLSKNSMNYNLYTTLAEVSFSETIFSDNWIYPLSCLYYRSKNGVESYQSIGCVWQNNMMKVFIPGDNGNNTDIYDKIFISGVILL